MCICVYCKYRRCVYMFVCTCICLCIHVFMCVCVSVCMCAHLHVCIWRPEGYLHVVSRTISIEDTSHDRQRLSLASKSQADEVGWVAKWGIHPSTSPQSWDDNVHQHATLFIVSPQACPRSTSNPRTSCLCFFNMWVPPQWSGPHACLGNSLFTFFQT